MSVVYLVRLESRVLRELHYHVPMTGKSNVCVVSSVKLSDSGKIWRVMSAINCSQIHIIMMLLCLTGSISQRL